MQKLTLKGGQKRVTAMAPSRFLPPQMVAMNPIVNPPVTVQPRAQPQQQQQQQQQQGGMNGAVVEDDDENVSQTSESRMRSTSPGRRIVNIQALEFHAMSKDELIDLVLQMRADMKQANMRSTAATTRVIREIVEDMEDARCQQLETENQSLLKQSKLLEHKVYMMSKTLADYKEMCRNLHTNHDAQTVSTAGSLNLDSISVLTAPRRSSRAEPAERGRPRSRSIGGGGGGGGGSGERPKRSKSADPATTLDRAKYQTEIGRIRAENERLKQSLLAAEQKFHKARKKHQLAFEEKCRNFKYRNKQSKKELADARAQLVEEVAKREALEMRLEEMQSRLEELQNQLENISSSTADSSSIFQSEDDDDDDDDDDGGGGVNGANARFATFSADSDVLRDFPELFGNCAAREAVDDDDDGSSNLSDGHAEQEDHGLLFDGTPSAHGTMPNATAAPSRTSKASHDFDENSTLSSDGASHLGNEVQEANGEEEAPSTRTLQAIPSGSAMTVQYFNGANGRHEDYDDASTVASSVRGQRRPAPPIPTVPQTC